MFQDHGLSMLQISSLLITWAACQMILEIPSGILADKIPRKYVLLIGSILKSFVFLFWLKHDYLFYSIGFIFWGISGALKSGTFLAFVYDELKNINKEKLYEKISARIKTVGFVGLAIALGIGGFVAKYSYDLALILSIIVSLLNIFVVTSFPVVKPYKSTEEKNYLIFLTNAIKETKKDKILLKLMIYFVMIMGFYGAYDEFADIVARNMGFGIAQVGLIGSATYMLIALGSYSAPYLLKIHKLLNNERLIFFLTGCLFFIVGLKPVPILILLLLVAEYLAAVGGVKLEAKIQHQIDSNKRATLLSVNNLLLEGFAIIATGIFGFLSQYSNTSKILLVTGGIFVILSLFFQQSNQNDSVKS